MEKSNKKFIIIIMLGLFVSLSLLLSKRLFYREDYVVTVIFKNNKDYNKLLKEGIDLASYEKNIVINYIHNYDNISDVIKEESNNSDGFIVLETNKEDIKNFKDLKIPIIFLGEDLDLSQNLSVSYINSDSFKMGQNIADEILKNGNTRENIIFIKDENILLSEENMYKGFCNSINLSHNKINQIIFGKENINKLMKDNKNNIFVTFEPYILNQLCEMKMKNKNFQSKQIYGMSKGNERIKYLENEIVQGIIVKNEFSLGYLSIDRIKKMIEKRPYNLEEVNFNIINKRNMYLKENQYLLFPFK